MVTFCFSGDLDGAVVIGIGNGIGNVIEIAIVTGDVRVIQLQVNNKRHFRHFLCSVASPNSLEDGQVM
jgi:phosphoribosylformylglycinamidine (FGAM) synthase-like amidotransferase family enzyme